MATRIYCELEGVEGPPEVEICESEPRHFPIFTRALSELPPLRAAPWSADHRRARRYHPRPRRADGAIPASIPGPFLGSFAISVQAIWAGSGKFCRFNGMRDGPLDRAQVRKCMKKRDRALNVGESEFLESAEESEKLGGHTAVVVIVPSVCCGIRILN